MQLPTQIPESAAPKRSFATTFLVAVLALLGVVCLLQSGDTSSLRAPAGYAAGALAPVAPAQAVSAAFPLAAFEAPRAAAPAMMQLSAADVDVSALTPKAAAQADLLPLLALAPGFAAARGGKLTMQAPAAPTGTGPGLMPGDPNSDPNVANYGRLSDKLKEADVERRKELEEIDKRERAAEIKREERLRKIAVLNEVPEDTKVGTVSDFMFKEGVREILEKLDYDLIGLVPVKARVREIASLLVVDKMRMKLGLETSVPSLHMGFTGAPGTGKTTVALRMGQILQKMGYCRTGHVVVATRDDLVGQYVGHTAPKTKEMVKKAMGGILLVDEAYYLYNAANDRDYGQESIEILLNVMENNKEDIVVVLAGYKDRMDKFYGFIPGMNSRIGNHIEFPNYGPDELVEIAKVMARELEYTMDDAAIAAFKEYITKRMELPFFSNARTVRNVVDLARMAAAVRVFNSKMSGGDGMVSEQELMTITAEDFPSIAELEEEQRKRQALCDAAAER